MAGSVAETEMVDEGVALGFWFGWGWDWALNSEFEVEFEVEVGGDELDMGV